MILNPLILSIDEDDTKDCFDLSINSIMKYIDIALRERRRSSALTDYRTPTDDLVDRNAMVTRYMKTKNDAIRRRRLTKR